MELTTENTMPKFEITFYQTHHYTMTIRAKDEEKAREKFDEKMENLTSSQLKKFLCDIDCFEIEDIEEIED